MTKLSTNFNSKEGCFLHDSPPEFHNIALSHFDGQREKTRDSTTGITVYHL